MSSFITRFLANMTMKESKTTPATESRPRRHERSSKQHHHHRSRHDYYRSSYVYDSDTESDDELQENSLMLDLGPDYSPKTMSTISFPSPAIRGSTVLFETEDLDASPEHIEVSKPAPTATNSQVKRKPVQYYDAPLRPLGMLFLALLRCFLFWIPVLRIRHPKPCASLPRPTIGSNVGGPRAGPPTLPRSVIASVGRPMRRGIVPGRSGGGSRPVASE